MTDFDLIDYAVPKGGIYCVVGMGAVTLQKFTRDRAELDAHIADFVERDFNVYITLGKSNKESRRAEDIESFASIWVDLDCGEGKATPNATTGIPAGYATQDDAEQALFDFCELVELPAPAIINSGNGLHAYWGFTEDVPRDKWLALAQRLKTLFTIQKFYADPSVYDAARVMRLPDTFNHKSDPPKRAFVKRPTNDRHNFEEFCELLGVDFEAPVSTVSKAGRVLDALDKVEVSNTDYSFYKIVTRETPCLQLVDAVRNPTTLSEPRWFDALSVAKFCNDNAKAIHKVSIGHPDYDFDAVERKITHIKWPHSCKQFDATHAGICKNCVHFKKDSKIKSPYSLGKEIRKDVTSPIKAKYPENYFRGENGGIYKKTSDDEDAEFIYDYDFYVKERLWDAEKKYLCYFVLHTPHDGVQEFTIPNNKLNKTDLLRELASNGVVAEPTKNDLLFKYVINSVRLLQHGRPADIMRTQFGWADQNTKFIVGEREITVDAEYHSPASTATEGLSPHFVPRGTLEKWQEAFNAYNQEGLEVQAFAALSGFGAPLLKLTGQKGAIINLVHKSAGTGKTTVLRMANSICGDPEKLLGTVNDSPPGRINKLGFLNNIVNTVDELTDMDNKEIGEYAYACSQGKGREKAERTANINRKNFITWNTITLTSSNASFYQKLRVGKAQPDGEMMRILEFEVDYQKKKTMTTEEGRELFDHQLNENYGHAILPYIQYIIANWDTVVEKLRAIQRKIDTELGLTQRERNWSAIIAANLTGGWIANKLGLIDFTMKRIYQEVCPVLLDMRAKTIAPVEQASAAIADFLSVHHANTLVITSTSDLRNSRPSADAVLPRGPLLIRHETDTKLTSIKASALREYLTKTQGDYDSAIAELKACGMLIAVKNTRLGKGAPTPSGAERSVILDGTHSDFVDPDYPADDKDESGESAVPDKLEEV